MSTNAAPSLECSGRARCVYFLEYFFRDHRTRQTRCVGRPWILAQMGVYRGWLIIPMAVRLKGLGYLRLF